MKAVIYARYSSDGQREESIDRFCQGGILQNLKSIMIFLNTRHFIDFSFYTP